MIVASVIPLLRVIRGLNAFDYAVPNALTIQPGMVVRIPFRSKTVRGFVISVKDIKRSSHSLKPIKNILFSEQLLPSYAQKTLLAIQKETLSPLPLLYRVFLPHIPTRSEKSILPPLPSCGADYASLHIPSSSVPSIRKLLSIKRTTLFHWHQSDERTIAILKLLEHHTQHGSVLVLFPNHESIKNFCRYIPNHLSKNVAVLTSSLPNNQFFAVWTALARGEKNILLTTRTGLLTPMKNLQCVIVDGEEQYGWKEEQNPRYDARVAIGLLAHSAKVPCILLSPSPTLDATERYKRSTIHTRPPSRRAFLLDDIHDLFAHPNCSYIGSPLEQRLERLHHGQHAVLFLNRHGFGSSVMCMNCKRVIQCPHCLLPLTHHKQESADVLRCHHCIHIEPIRLLCPYCNSTQIKSVGKGIERIQEEARVRFPNISIQCCTYPTLNTLLWQRKTPDLIGVIDALSPLHMPDFRSLENVWHFLDTLTAYTATQKIPLIIQTFSPEHPIFDSLSHNNTRIFYDAELAERKKLLYPPFTRLIKLIVKNEENARAYADAKKLFELCAEIKPTEPYCAHPPRQNGKFVWQLLLRVPTHASLSRILKNLPSNVIIDVDPESTL